MRKQLFALAALAATSFTACKKDKKDDVAPCTTGKVRFTNTSSNPYKIYIDGTYKDMLQGGYYQEFTVNNGTHTLRVVQQSGFVLYPTDQSQTVVVNCNEKEYIFP